MKSLFFLLSLYIFYPAIAQSNKTDIIDPEHLSYKEFRLRAQRTAPGSIHLPFEKINIIDSRFDTTKVGFIPTDIEFIHDKRNFFKKVRFKDSKSVAGAIEKYYNDYYQNSFTENGFTLLIVMKRFWVSGIDYRTAQAIDLTYNADSDDNLYCKWEYYIGKNDLYLPVKRVDTIMDTDDELSQYLDEDFSERRLGKFKFLLKTLIELYDFEKGINNYELKPKKSISEIRDYNEKRFDLPVLKQPILNKGVFLSYNDFKNNQPSILNFVEKKMHYSITKAERYLTDSAGNNINNYWGYSDGEDFRYGKYGNDKIFRKGNTFQFFVQVIFISPNVTTPVVTRNKLKVWVPYQLDMETGNIY